MKKVGLTKNKTYSQILLLLSINPFIILKEFACLTFYIITSVLENRHDIREIMNEITERVIIRQH